MKYSRVYISNMMSTPSRSRVLTPLGRFADTIKTIFNRKSYEQQNVVTAGIQQTRRQENEAGRQNFRDLVDNEIPKGQRRVIEL